MRESAVPVAHDGHQQTSGRPTRTVDNHAQRPRGVRRPGERPRIFALEISVHTPLTRRMGLNISDKKIGKRKQKRRAWILVFCFLIPWLLAIKDGFDLILLPASKTALSAAYLLGLAYYSALSQLTLSVLPAFREQWAHKGRGVGSLIAVSALFAVVPMWTFPTAITEVLGTPETAEVMVYGKSSGQHQRHTCRYSLTVFPLNGNLTSICVSEAEWMKSSSGTLLVIRGKRSPFGYVVSEARPRG
ncbi:hypothetical protein B0G69_0103 [Paraburkholderia sp. RAU2J]|nr:hypothetical protein B0G69_0103 [Paraburkholderia sp. RAU2J]